MASTLDQQLLQIADAMSPAERAGLKILLGAAAAELLQNAEPGNVTLGGGALSTTIRTVARLQPHRHLVPPDGIVYRGRPPFLTDELLTRLRIESDALRPTAVRFHDHLVVSGAPGAREVAFSPELGEIVRQHAGPLDPTAKANYLYYDEVGLGIEPHLDNDEFSLNAILMLRHEHAGHPSALVLYPVASPPQRICLQPGEMIIMFADSVVHARERVGPGERIGIAAFGFAPSPDS